MLSTHMLRVWQSSQRSEIVSTGSESSSRDGADLARCLETISLADGDELMPLQGVKCRRAVD